MIGDDKVQREWHRMDRTDSEPVSSNAWVILGIMCALILISLLFI